MDIIVGFQDRGGVMVTVGLGHTWRLMREALRGVLARENDLEVVAEAATVDELVTQARRSRPDIAVIDIGLSGMRSVDDLCRQICGILPGCGILVLLDRRTNPGA